MKTGTRIFLGFLVVFGLGFWFLVDWITDDLRPRYLESMEEAMVDTATILSSVLANYVNNDGIDVEDFRKAFGKASQREFSAAIYSLVKTRLDMRVYVTDAQGMVVFDSNGGKDEGKDYSHWNDVYLTLRGKYGARTTRTDPDDPRTAVLYVASPILVDGQLAGVLTVVKPADSVSLFIETAKAKIMAGGLLVGLTVVLLGVLVTFWVTRPIQRLTEYVKAVRDGERVALPDLGRSEIGMLGRAFEETREALEGKKYIENYVQTLTHEVKGPLSAIRGAAELLEEEMPPERRAAFVSNIRTESTRIQKVVDDLLELSSLESRKGLEEIREVDLVPLVSEVLESMKSLVEAKKLVLKNSLKEPAIIHCERSLVRRAIASLIQNAIGFSPEGGTIGLSTERHGEYLDVIITDEGPGIPEYALERVFEKFYSLRRPDTGTKSSGLGLSIASEVAALHNGEIKLENRPEGGARAILHLSITPGAELSS